VQDVAVEKDDIAGFGRDQDLRVLIGDPRQVVLLIVGVTDASDVLDSL